VSTGGQSIIKHRLILRHRQA